MQAEHAEAELPRPRRRTLLPWLLALGVLGGLLAASLLIVRFPAGVLIEITDPAPGATVGESALEVMVRFPHQEQTRAETLRVRLNGADVTESFTAAENGAYGRLMMLVDGPNTLEVAVFGRPWWGGTRLVEQVKRVRFRVRREMHRHWARAGASGPRPWAGQTTAPRGVDAGLPS